jgi:pimeloyl-ACP methyl ester carboxylesterase
VRLLVIHGERDEVCPPSDGREIADAANRASPGAAEYVELTGTGHTDGWPGAGPAVTRALASL